MSELLSNPLVQSAVLPFGLGLVVALLLRPHGWYWAGLSAVAGFTATAYLLTDLQLFPLRSDRKILLLGAVALMLGALLDVLPWRRMVKGLVVLGAAGSALWLLWPRFRFLEGLEFWGLAVAGTLYVVWLSVSTLGLRDQALKADAMLLALALGTGLSALLGATALYGQLGSAIAAAVGARLLLHLLGKPVAAGYLMLLPMVLVCALLGLGAVAYATLPWFSLAALALVPLLIRVPLPAGLPRVVNMMLLVMLALLPAALAVFLTWQESGAPPI